jgi:RNA polymerase sigma factor (sigma-70 family)
MVVAAHKTQPPSILCMPAAFDGLSDAELVYRTRLGDTRCFEQLLHRHFASAFGVAFSHTENRADAEDVCQAAFLKAYERLGRCQHPDRFGSWLTAIVRNEARNSLRGRHRANIVPLSDDTPIATERQPDARFDVAERQGRMWGVLRRLPVLEREVVLLHLLDDLSHAVIARSLGISEFTSRHYLSRAKKKLRVWLASELEPRESA